MLLEKYREAAQRAHNGTSFSPEKRGDTIVRECSEELAADMEQVAALGGDPEVYRARYERHFSAWIAAKSRCISSMITGPSNFPVRRAEKARNSEHNRFKEFVDWRQNYLDRLARNKRRADRAATDPVAEMREKLEKAERWQELMRSANKIVKSKKLSDAEKVDRLQSELHFGEKAALEVLRPDCFGWVGFAPYQFTNNLANIKRMRDRLTELERKAATETTATERPDGIRVVENSEADRIQIFFPGKPDSNTISRLKSRAFKWSPSNGCWQRQLTENARRAAAEVIPQ
jgi:hypothetical protein